VTGKIHTNVIRKGGVMARSVPPVDHRYRKMPQPESPEAYAWMTNARCRGAHPNKFFPTDGIGVDRTRRLCQDCLVRSECLEYALTNRITYGTWGGTSERERARILQRQTVQPATPNT
jgi:WhiB family redox-sensing transcriptional regulator